MPFGYLEFSRAKRRELCPHMQACARAAAGGRPAPARARARARVWVWVPYLAWFFLKQVSRVWVTPLLEPNLLRSDNRSAPDPNSPPTNGCLRTDPNRPPTAVGKPSVRLGGWTVVRFGQLNGCDGSVRTVATADFWRTRMPSRSAINSAPDFHSQTHQKQSLSLYLSSELAVKF